MSGGISESVQRAADEGALVPAHRVGATTTPAQSRRLLQFVLDVPAPFSRIIAWI